jgi:branched-chain amino acid transport system permease protein
MDFSTFLIQTLNSVQYGLLLFLVAAGLTLIFGIMGVINLAHGSFYMMGSYLAFALSPMVAEAFGGGLISTFIIGIVIAIILGYILEWMFYSYLYERDHLQQVLMTYGLILVIEEIRSILVGDDVHGVASGVRVRVRFRTTFSPSECGKHSSVNLRSVRCWIPGSC